MNINYMHELANTMNINCMHEPAYVFHKPLKIVTWLGKTLPKLCNYAFLQLTDAALPLKCGLGH